MIYEIEDTEGNMLMAFEVKFNKIIRMYRCSVADEDKDYIFKSKQKLIRIQQED